MSQRTVSWRQTFTSLEIRNYRLYFSGQAVSLCGTWMQRIAQSWLVLEITGSGTMVGAVAATQFLPILLLAPLGGLVADRVDKRRLLFVTQAAAAVSTLSLGVVVLAGVVQLWMVFASALLLGLANSFDSPTRHSFVLEMVGRDQVTNAVSLHSTLVNAARIVGPAIGGVLIVTIGIGWVFVLNAVSYLGLVVALRLMNESDLHRAPTNPRGPRQLREGMRYAIANPELSMTLLLLAVAGIFVYEYEVVLPLFARFSFGGDAQTFSWMMTAMGVGAVVGGLVTAARANRSPSALIPVGFAFGGLQLLVSLAPNISLALVGLALVGAAGISFLALANSTLQLVSAPEMRGRVMGLYLVAFLGTRPLGGPIVGWVGERAGPRWALALGGVTLMVTASLVLIRAKKEAREGRAGGKDDSTALDPPIEQPGSGRSAEGRHHFLGE